MSAFPEPELFQVPVAPDPVAPEAPQGPFPEPTPRPEPTVNLTHHSTGLEIRGAEPSGNYRLENIAISWWVKNAGPFTTSQSFSVEIRFDGVIVAQWAAQGLATNSFIYVEDRADLFSGVVAEPGVHEISLVIDPLDSINETVETDNTLVRQVTILASETDDVPLELRPNLVPAPYTGKSEPIFVSTHREDPVSGKLSVDRPAYLAIGAYNESIQYITEKIELDLYVDGMLARRLIWTDLAAAGSLQFDIADLRELIGISPGPHTLKVVVDPMDRIRESDETDNAYEVELVWGIGEPSPPAEPFVLAPPPREPTLRANLTAYRPFGWDAAVTARIDNGLADEGTDGRLEARKAARIDFAFTNASRFSLPLTDQLQADVLVDGELVERLRFNSGSSNVGSIWRDSAVIFAGRLTPGEHTVRVVLDPEGLFDELSETDNVFERTFTWHDGPDSSVPEPFHMTDQELDEAFAPLFGEMMRQVQPVAGPGSTGRDWTLEIRAAGRAAYYLLTGRDVEEEGYVINFLPHDEFISRSVAACMSNWIIMSVAEYESEFEFCTEDRNWAGFKTRANGQVHLFVDLSNSPMQVLSTYLHELGHALQDLINPSQTELPWTMNTRGLFEAQAQIFDAAGLRKIEEFTGKSLSAFPDVEPAARRFEFLFDLRTGRDTEHDIGFRILWAQALTDSADLQVAEELRSQGVLSADSAMALYGYLVNMPGYLVESEVAELLERTDLMAEFRQISSGRLQPDLPLDMIVNPALQRSAWIAP